MTTARLLGLATGTLSAAALYALVRGVQFLAFPEQNPATIIASEHSGYFWRIWIVVYGGGMAAFVGELFARRDPDRVARVLARALPSIVALIAVQAILLP